MYNEITKYIGGIFMENKNIYELLESEIMKSDLSEEEKNKKLSKLLKARGQKINLMLVGATGSGKSSTINALFNTKVAKVGVGVDPETADIECYQLENLTIWDTPGIGDGIENDKAHTEQIVRKLSEVDENGVPVIDLVMVIVDGSNRDLSATYEMINTVIIPAITKENSKRILIAVNQADLAMKGAHWDKENNCPDDELKEFLEKKCASIKERVLTSTGVEVEPIYYCAGYTDPSEYKDSDSDGYSVLSNSLNQMFGIKKDGENVNGEVTEQTEIKDYCKPYNLTKLLYHIILSLPAEKRMAIAENLNDDKNMWRYDDNETNYHDAISQSFGEVLWDTVSDYAEKGVVYGGAILGMPGAIVGSVVCGTVGAIVGVFKGLFG